MKKVARAARGGTVRAVGSDGGCGVTVRVYHAAVDADVRYYHLVTGSPGSYNVYSGKAVVEEAPLGDIGTTGTSTGVHLHFDPDRGGIVSGNTGVNGTYGMRGYDCYLRKSPIYAGDWRVNRRYAWQSTACND
ncbi:M23 family metallopeptidase [Truepera radiovictrix]|uniref:M23 family metallopeptidase n=1 Tax=Truepera radiovictrix TaxID=332249 RepID=UPI00160FE0E1